MGKASEFEKKIRGWDEVFSATEPFGLAVPGWPGTGGDQSGPQEGGGLAKPGPGRHHHNVQHADEGSKVERGGGEARPEAERLAVHPAHLQHHPWGRGRGGGRHAHRQTNSTRGVWLGASGLGASNVPMPMPIPVKGFPQIRARDSTLIRDDS